MVTPGLDRALPRTPSRPGRFRRAWRIPLADKLAIVPAWLAIAGAAALITLVPFVRLAAGLGRNIGAAGFTPLIGRRGEARARFVQRAVQRAARLAPFRSDCLPQALVAAMFCRWLGVPTATHFGVEIEAVPTGRSLSAHAWVDAGGVRVSGGRGEGRFTVVACFVTLPSPR
ncbi:lasso peptide biosynthesis B2 protein [Sphingomonas immobilis]|nr:lasso peptide biosynthesis B2 protein [Sphingomonas sp. CA1-15]